MGCCHGSRMYRMNPAAKGISVYTPIAKIDQGEDPKPNPYLADPHVTCGEGRRGSPARCAENSVPPHDDERSGCGTPEIDWDWENPCLELPGWLVYDLQTKNLLKKKAGDDDSESSGGMSDIS